MSQSAFMTMYAIDTKSIPIPIGLIFITTSMGLLVNFGMTIVSVFFSAFMNCLELLVACLQAYIFTLLSANYIGLAKVED